MNNSPHDPVMSLVESFDLTEKDICRVITDVHLEEFTRNYGEDWRLIHAYLKINSIVVRDTERKPGGEREKRHAFYSEWKFLKGPDATYERLICALLKLRCQLDAEAVCTMLQGSQESVSSGSSVPTPAAPTATTGIIVQRCNFM